MDKHIPVDLVNFPQKKSKRILENLTNIQNAIFFVLQGQIWTNIISEPTLKKGKIKSG